MFCFIPAAITLFINVKKISLFQDCDANANCNTKPETTQKQEGVGLCRTLLKYIKNNNNNNRKQAEQSGLKTFALDIYNWMPN